LVEVAQKSENPEHLLLAYSTKSILTSSIAYNPTAVAEFCEKALPIYSALQQTVTSPQIFLTPQRKDSLTSLFGANIGCVLTVIYSVALGRLGRYDRSREQMLSAIRLAKSLNHPPSLQCVYSTMQQFKSTRGEIITIEESNSMRKGVSGSSWWRPFGDIALAASVIEYSENQADKGDAHRMLVSAIDQVIANFGSLTELTVRISSLRAWKRIDVETGLLHANALLDRVDKTGISGSFTRADLLTRRGNFIGRYWEINRKLAELLLWKQGEDPIAQEFTELEAKATLSAAYREALNYSNFSCAMAALLMSAKLCSRRSEW
jgi:hypothetical protein